MRKLLFLLAAIITVSLTFPLASQAHTISNEPYPFNPNKLISDSDFLNYGSMSGDDVNGWLGSKGSWLANYVIPQYVDVPYFCRDGSGNPIIQTVSVQQVGPSGTPFYGMRAADLLVARAQANKVNPQDILVLLERESSSVTSASPSSNITKAWPLFYGFDEVMAAYNYSCSQAAQVAQNYGGVGQQLAYTAYGLKQLFNGIGCPYNSTPTIDGVQLNLESRASAVLYCYTPHIHNGNHNFWYLFLEWFGGIQPPPYRPPLVLKDSKVYIADQGQLWHIKDADTFNAWGFNWPSISAIEGTPYASYPIAGDVSKLIRTSWGRVFLVQDGKKRPIMSARIFNLFGFNWNDVTPINDQMIDAIPTGIPLWELVRVQGTSPVYFQSRGMNYHVLDPATFQDVWRFDWAEVADVPSYEVLQFPTGKDLTRFALANDGTVYYMDDGHKFRIPSADVFNQFHFDWSQLDATESSFLDHFPTQGTLTQLIGAPDGRVFYVTDGVKHYVNYSAFVSHGFKFSDVAYLSWGALNSIPNGSDL